MRTWWLCVVMYGVLFSMQSRSYGQRSLDPSELTVPAWLRIVRNPKQAHTLETGRDDTAAIAVRWHHSVTPSWKGSRQVQLPATQLYSFVGFVEGRLRLKLPTWWTQRLAQVFGQAVDANAGHAVQLPNAYAYNRREDVSLRHSAGRCTIVDQNGNERMIEVPEALQPRSNEFGARAIGIAPDKSSIALVNIDAMHTDPTVALVDRGTGRLQWKRTVKPRTGGGFSFGEAGPHHAELLLEQNRVILVGVKENRQFYLYILNRVDGRVLALWQSELAFDVLHGEQEEPMK